jgi:hypothetical protein
VNGWYFDGSAQDLAKKIIEGLSNIQGLNKMGRVSVGIVEKKINIINMVSAYIRAFKQVI